MTDRALLDVDAEIDDLIVACDDRAVEMMWDRYAAHIRAYALQRLGSRSDQEAGDIAVDAIMYVWKRREDFDPQRGSAKLLVFGKAKRLTIDRIRRRRCLTVAGTTQSICDPVYTPHDPAIRREEVAAAIACLEQLTDLERESLLAKHRIGRGYDRAVAKNHGTSPESVRQAASCGQKKLKNVMRERGFDVE